MVSAPAERTFIYGLLDPRDGCLRYVGKSNTPWERAKSHLWPTSLRAKTHRTHWLLELRGLGLYPELVVLEEVSVAAWEEAERFHIAYWKALGCQLTNGDAGGRGTGQQRADTKQAISRANRGRKASPAQLAVLQRLAAAKRGSKISPEESARRSTALKGRSGRPKGIPMSEEAKAKITAAMLGRKQSPETRAKISAGNKAYAAKRKQAAEHAD